MTFVRSAHFRHILCRDFTVLEPTAHNDVIRRSSSLPSREFSLQNCDLPPLEHMTCGKSLLISIICTLEGALNFNALSWQRCRLLTQVPHFGLIYDCDAFVAIACCNRELCVFDDDVEFDAAVTSAVSQRNVQILQPFHPHAAHGRRQRRCINNHHVLLNTHTPVPVDNSL